MLGSVEEDTVMINASGSAQYSECIKMCQATSAGNNNILNICSQGCIDKYTAEKGGNTSSVLEGTASVINALAGIFGTYTYGKQGQTYSPAGSVVGDFPLDEESPEQKNKKRNSIIIGVGVVLVIGIGAFLVIRNANKDGE